MKGQCVYNAKWESDPQYKEWIGALKGDKKKALCKLCDRLILLSSMGESALKSHAKSEKHKNIIQSKQGITLSDFGFGSSATASTSGEVKKVTAMFTSETDLIVSPPLEDAAAAPKVPGSVKSFLIKDDVLRAEILWTLKAVTSHMSFSSSKNMSELLPKMFPDSEIAKQFQCGERKMAYVCVYGLAEFFKKLLNESIKGQFVVLFDESLNKKMQEKQMDVHVRYIDEANEVKTRYFGSTFLGHGTANDLMDHFTKSVLESGLPVKNMIQVSMDGPNVNWKFYGNLKKKLNDEYGTSLINIGSCGLHIVHNSFKRGMDATGWKVASFLSSLYYLFKDAPARKEDYVNVTSATLMPLKFVKHRWLENVPVCQRALDTWDSIVKFVKATQSGQLNKPNNKSYEIVKECVNDKCFLAKLHFFKCIASLLQPFLKKYQTDKPMMPFISDDLCMIIRTLMRRFIKNEYLECSNEKLIKIDVSDKNLQVNYKKIDIGYASEKLKNVKPSEREILEFRMECKACLVDLLKKLLEKCPATYSLVRHLSYLNPVNMASDKEVCSAKFKKVLMLLLSSGRISEKDCDPLLQEYGLFLDNIPVFGTIKFSNFDNSTNRLDSLFFEYMSGPNYIQLLSVVKLILVMSHGQASVERGFNINKEIEVENMKEHTLVARRMVCDHVNTVKGVTSVDINKSLLLSVKHSRKKYEQYLEQQRVNKKSDDLRAKRKSTLEEIEEIKKKKRRLDADIKCLNETADQLLQKAEDEGKLSHLTKANSFRRTAKDKMQQLVQTDISLKDQLQKLKTSQDTYSIGTQSSSFNDNAESSEYENQILKIVSEEENKIDGSSDELSTEITNIKVPKNRTEVFLNSDSHKHHFFPTSVPVQWKPINSIDITIPANEKKYLEDLEDWGELISTNKETSLNQRTIRSPKQLEKIANNNTATPEKVQHATNEKLSDARSKIVKTSSPNNEKDVPLTSTNKETLQHQRPVQSPNRNKDIVNTITVSPEKIHHASDEELNNTRSEIAKMSSPNKEKDMSTDRQDCNVTSSQSNPASNRIPLNKSLINDNHLIGGAKYFSLKNHIINMKFDIKKGLMEENERLAKLSHIACSQEISEKKFHLYPVVRLDKCKVSPQKLNISNYTKSKNTYVERSFSSSSKGNNDNSKQLNKDEILNVRSVLFDKSYEISKSDILNCNNIVGQSSGHQDDCETHCTDYSSCVSSSQSSATNKPKFDIKKELMKENERLAKLSHSARSEEISGKKCYLYPVVRLEKCKVSPQKLNISNYTKSKDTYVERSCFSSNNNNNNNCNNIVGQSSGHQDDCETHCTDYSSCVSSSQSSVKNEPIFTTPKKKRKIDKNSNARECLDFNEIVSETTDESGYDRSPSLLPSAPQTNIYESAQMKNDISLSSKKFKFADFSLLSQNLHSKDDLIDSLEFVPSINSLTLSDHPKDSSDHTEIHENSSLLHNGPSAHEHKISSPNNNCRLIDLTLSGKTSQHSTSSSSSSLTNESLESVDFGKICQNFLKFQKSKKGTHRQDYRKSDINHCDLVMKLDERFNQNAEKIFKKKDIARMQRTLKEIVKPLLKP
ncbi:hypothetical protein GQR58_007120 [Nymphon striatum]|nr:hypothetical protein GQR58_007120 [Nymphon striatum]